MALAQRIRCVQSATAQQAEITGVARHGCRHRPFEQAIEQRRSASFQEALTLARGPLRINDLITFLPALDEFWNELRRVLKVCVDDDDRISVRVIEAGGQRQLLAEVATQIDDCDALVAPPQLEQQTETAVGAAVVHVDDLSREFEAREHRHESLMELTNN